MKGRCAAAVALCLLLSGCGIDFGGVDPCRIDPESCEANTDWPANAQCTATGPLTLQMGNGEGDFAPYTDENLRFHSSPGGGQGGDVHHFFLGVRIGNPDAVHRRFKLTVQLPKCHFGPILPPADADASAGDPSANASAGPEVTKTDFILSTTLKPQADGSLVRTGLRVRYSCDPNRVTVTVIDECGRTASDAHLFSHFVDAN